MSQNGVIVGMTKKYPQSEITQKQPQLFQTTMGQYIG